MRVITPGELICGYDGMLSTDKIQRHWQKLPQRFVENREIVRKALGKS